MQDSSSFWTDIKNLEEQLAKSPDSYCFARLSEVYLKVGLVDDALHVARKGTMKFPGYLAGQRYLSLACHAKGFNDEAIIALKQIVEALPEDVPSQKLLGRLYAEAGNIQGACQAFRTALEFAPEDVECRIELESLERCTKEVDCRHAADEQDEDIIEDLDMLEELDILEEDCSESDLCSQDDVPESVTPDVACPSHHDPLSTGTLAELYVKQGFVHKAVDIYRAILIENPADSAAATRISELEELDAAPVESEQETDDLYSEEVACDTVPIDSIITAQETAHEEPNATTVEAVQETDDSYIEETTDEPSFSNPVESIIQEAVVASVPKREDMSVNEFSRLGADDSRDTFTDSPEFSSGSADAAVAVLEGWLENIRRIKLCH